MAIRRDEVEKIAELARLEIPEDRIERMRAELSSVLEFVAQLQRLDLAHQQAVVLAPAGQPLRADVPDGRRLASEVALAAAPEAEDGFFLVPPIVENLEP
jgi:aspartyl-tRNA(Asn)/glutamyl-tRNA(Gln) amidotransferase subunit C